MREAVRAFKALSDETRLRIINILLERECCVCEVVQVLAISQTRASRNLGILHDAGFLQMRKAGLWSLYSIDLEELPEYLADMVEAVREALQENPIAIQDREQLKTAQRTGVSCCVRAGCREAEG